MPMSLPRWHAQPQNWRCRHLCHPVICHGLTCLTALLAEVHRQLAEARAHAAAKQASHTQLHAELEALRQQAAADQQSIVALREESQAVQGHLAASQAAVAALEAQVAGLQAVAASREQELEAAFAKLEGGMPTRWGWQGVALGRQHAMPGGACFIALHWHGFP